MRSINIISLIIFLSIVAISCSEKVESISLKTEIYCDHCKECEYCEARVEGALLKTAGVNSAEMDVENATISVGYDAKKIDELKIKHVIAKTGYSAGDVKADPAGYDELDDCCKKK